MTTIHNTGIVVADLDTTIPFFIDLGLELEGRAPVEGPWAGDITGLPGQRVEIAMLRTPDGHNRIELCSFITPATIPAHDHRHAPVNSLGYLRLMFNVPDLDATLALLQKHHIELVGKIVNYENIYRLCYIRGPEGILLGLAQDL